MKKLLFVLVLTALAFCGFSQQKDSANFLYDTARTNCLVMYNLNTGASGTMWCFRITKSKMDYNRNSNPTITDSTTIFKKEKTVVDVVYFAPFTVTDSIDKKKVSVVYREIPRNLVLNDFNINIPPPTQSVTSPAKIPGKGRKK